MEMTKITHEKGVPTTLMVREHATDDTDDDDDDESDDQRAAFTDRHQSHLFGHQKGLSRMRERRFPRAPGSYSRISAVVGVWEI